MPSPTPNPDSQPVTGKIVSDSANNAHVQRDTLAPDQGKPDLSQHEAWQNQHSTSFPDPRLNSDASSTTYGAQPGENGETPVSSSSITGHHERVNLPQPDPNVPHQFPNPHESSGTLSSHQVNPDPSLQTNSSNNTHVQSGTFSGGGPGQHVDGLGSSDTTAASAVSPTASSAIYGDNGTPIEQTSGTTSPSPQNYVSAPASAGDASSAGSNSEGFPENEPSNSSDGPPLSTEGYSQSDGVSSGSASFPNASGASIGAAFAAGATEQKPPTPLYKTPGHAQDSNNGWNNWPTYTPEGTSASNDSGEAPTVSVSGASNPTTSVDFSKEPKAQENVKFSDAAADTLRQALRTAGNNLTKSYGQAGGGGSSGGRDQQLTESCASFTGKYSEDFKDRHAQLKANATNVAAMLLYAADLVDYFKECVARENRNRQHARDWEDRWFWQRWGDSIESTWNDDVGPGYEGAPAKPVAPSSVAAPAPPAPSSGSGTSSAMPDNLDVYVIRCNDDTNTHINEYRAINDAFTAFDSARDTSFGTLDISPAMSGLKTLNEQSNLVTDWLHKVAQAFRDAGASSGNPVALADSTLDAQVGPQISLTHIDVTLPQVSGATPTSGFANDPVNVATGNFIEPETDLIFAGTTSAMTLSLKRMYNSLAVTHTDEVPSGVFGLGWFSTLDTHLSFEDEQASWFMSDGRAVLFDREGEGFARAAREPWWLTKVPATDELFTRVRDAQMRAYEQATVTGGSAVVPEVPFLWMTHNNQHEAYFYAPSGAPVAHRQGHLSSLTVFVLDAENRVTDLVHPVAHRGVHVDYEPAEETGSVRPAAAFTYNTVGERAGKPVQNVVYSYTEAAESSASVQVSGLLTEVTTGAGTRTYTHTERGLIHRVINSRGDLEVTNTYDDSGRVIGQISEYGRDISYRYTPNVTTIIADADTGENSNLWVSDAKGRLLSITATDGTRMSMSYDRFSNRVSITERDGSRLVRTSDARGHIKRERTPEGADYTYTWDEQDRLLSVSVRDARDVKNLSEPMPVSSYRYEEGSWVVNPNPIAVLNGAGEATTWEYSPEGDILKISDPTGVYITLEYDEHHDIVALGDVAGNTTRFTRDIAGQITSVTNPLGATTTLEYNEAGVISAVINPLGAKWSFVYPESPVGDGTPYMAREQLQGGTRNSAVGTLPSAVINPDGATVEFTYTAGGDIATVTDAAGGKTHREYDTFGNLVKMVTAGNRVWEYSWDGLSQLISLTDPTGAITRFEYDHAGEITQITDATGVISRRSIDRREGVESVAGTGEGLFSSAFCKVDVLGRVTEIGQQDGTSRSSVSSSHSASGVPTGAGAAGAGIASTTGTGISHGVSSSTEAIAAAGTSSQSTGRQMFTYDAAGNIVEALDANGGLTRYVRDAAGRVTRIISAAGRFTDYTYDTCGRLSSERVGLNEPVRVTDPVTGASSWEEPTRWAVTTLVYDAASQVIERHTPDGLVEKMTYDAAGRLIKVQAGRRVATYAWDACNQLVRVQDSTFGTRRYSYNELGQLVRVTDGLGNRTFFAYDADGLLTSVTDPTGAITEYEYDAAGRILEVAKKPHPDSAVETPAIRTTYTWDAAGRLLSEDDGVRTRSFEYDARTGDLTRTLIDGSLAAEYGTGTPALPGSTITWMKDHTGDTPVTYRRVFDATGNLIEYTRQVDGTENTSDPGTAEALETFTSTGSYTLTYAYDADGFRTMMFTPYGSSQWMLDGAGRPIRSINTASIAGPSVRERESVIGEFSYDVMGHLVRAQVGETISTWDFEQDGLVSSYEHTSEQGDENTAEGVQVIRDHTGRIIGLDSTTSGLVMYSYDEAGQLTGARADGYELTWVYEGGLMVAERLYHHNTTEDETTQGRVLLGERQFIYNGLNQLLHCTTIERPHTPEGASAAWVSTEVSYTYNAAGQRTGQKSVTSDGVIRERTYTWGITGALATVSDTTNTGDITVGSRLRVHADAAGVATAITGNDQVTVPLLWDPTSSAPQLLGAGSIPVAGADGGFSQAAVPGGFDPWSVPGVPNTGDMVGFGALSAPGLGGISATGAPQTPGAPTLPSALGGTGASALLTSVGLPEGVSFTGSGTLAVGGLALMGARVFDPSSKKFLSQDPLPPIIGAGWFADSYSFLGHDPVGMIDPWGTAPLSHEDFKKYVDTQNTQTLYHIAGATIMAVSLVCGPAAPYVAIAGAGVYGVGDGTKMNADGTYDKGSMIKGGVTQAAIQVTTFGLGKAVTATGVGTMVGNGTSKAATYVGSKLPAVSGVTTKLASETGKKYATEAFASGVTNSAANTLGYIKDADHPTVAGATVNAVTGFGSGVLTHGIEQKVNSALPEMKTPTTLPGKVKYSLRQEAVSRGSSLPGASLLEQPVQDKTVAHDQNGKDYSYLNSVGTGAYNKVVGTGIDNVATGTGLKHLENDHGRYGVHYGAKPNEGFKDPETSKTPRHQKGVEGPRHRKEGPAK